MNRLNRALGVIIVIFILVVASACNSEGDNEVKEPSFNKNISRVALYRENGLEDYKLIDWRERALSFDQLIFNPDATGLHLPLIWQDDTYETFGLPAYVGDGRMHQDGAQEAVTNIATIVSASLLGMDKSDEEGIDYVEQLSAFYSEDEQIILNNPAGSSETTSMWYLLYPTILFSQASDLYEGHEELRDQTLTAIESWYDAHLVMHGEDEPNYDYTGFNFLTQEPYANDVWIEPDSAIGIGLLMYYGYEMTGEKKYLQASIDTLDYIEDYFGSPLYEVLMYYAPYLSAKLNALHGTDYDVGALLDDTFSDTAIPRGGWGSIVGTWGDYPMNGLFGSTSDGGGYAFTMNTFAAAGAVLPVVQYDARYAKSIGEWMLHLVSNSRYYFATETNAENQSITRDENVDQIDDQIKHAIPYEGIRKESQGRSPWFGGDPTVYDWAETDFSLYSGAHIGVLASLIEETSVEGILRLDLLATQFYNTEDFPTYLFYNPYDKAKEVDYHVESEEAVDLFNTMTNDVIKSNVTDSVVIEIPADDALVIVEIPAGATIDHVDKNYFVDETFISRDHVTLNIVSHKIDDTVSGQFDLELALSANYDTSIADVIVDIEDESFNFDGEETIELNADDFRLGRKRVMVKIETEDGAKDETSVRLQFE